MKFIIPVHNGVTDSEFIYIYHRLLEESHQVDVVSTNGQDVVADKGWPIKVTPRINMSRILTYNMDYALDLATVYDGIVIPGGVKSIEKLRQLPILIKLIKYLFTQGKLVGAMCHGTQLLIEADIVRDKKVTGYYSIQTDIKNAGGIYINSASVVSGNIITSPHYNYNHDFMRKVIEWIRHFPLQIKP